MTRQFGSKAMTKKQGRTQFLLLVNGCTDAALERLTPDQCAKSYAGVTIAEANKALLEERLRRSAR